LIIKTHYKGDDFLIFKKFAASLLAISLLFATCGCAEQGELPGECVADTSVTQLALTTISATEISTTTSVSNTPETTSIDEESAQEEFLQNLSIKLNKPKRDIGDLDIDYASDVTSNDRWWEPINFRESEILKNYTEIDIHSDDVNLSDFPDNNTIETINIRETQNNTLNGIEHFKALKNLNFYSGHVTIHDISAIINCPKLESIVFRFTYEISDYSPVGDLYNLKSLIFFTNEVKGIDSISNCTKLESLYLQDVEIDNLDFISGLTNLKELRLYCTYESIEPLKYLVNLESLELKHNLSQNDLLILSNMTWLHNIEIYGADENVIEILRNAIPNCKINEQ
jgi:hypothetical protein